MRRVRPISAYNVSTVRAREKSSIITNRKWTTRFPTSYRWSPYVTPNFLKRVAQKANLSFKNRFSYISVIDVASDFKFRMQLRYAKAHHEIPLEEKGYIGEVPEVWGFPFNIFATAKASDFKFGTQLGFAKAHHKITQEKVGMALG